MPLPKTIIAEKSVGETPLQALGKIRAERPELGGAKLAYAGRLDPMASGKLLVLVGDECKRRDKYLGLDKEYEVEVLLGASTDTGDVLGLLQPKPIHTPPQAQHLVPNIISDVLSKQVGRHSWGYPAFSSKPAQNAAGETKQLFMWALEDRLGEIEMPKVDIEIYELELLGVRETHKEELHKTIVSKISSLPKVTEKSKELGRDFRRGEVLGSWDEFFKSVPDDRAFPIVALRCKCSSGSYMRTLAEKLGEDLGTPALALSIHRTRIG